MLVSSVIAEVIAASRSLSSPKQFLDEALRQAARLVPFDSAILLPRARGQPGEVNKPSGHADIYRHYRENEAAFANELVRDRVVAARDGTFIDTEQYSAAERRRMRFFNEIVRPQGITERIVGYVSFRARNTATLQLCRHGRAPRFRARDIEQIQRILPAIGLAHVALLSATDAPRGGGEQPELERLSERERQIAFYVRLGYQTKEIAALLGTSPYTVRNQLSSIFDKLGITSRAELAARFATDDL